MTEKRMRNHWLSTHGRQGLATVDWQAAPLQTFFKGNLLRYFTGTPSKILSKNTVQIIRQTRTEHWAEQLADPNLSLSSTPSSTTSSRSLSESDNLLMLHFTTYTWLTLTNDEDTQQIWHVIVPQLAYQYEYLKHVLLACAALHMAYLNPKRRSELVIQARTHQDLAIPLFLVATRSLESEICDAVLIFVRLLGITSYALDESLIAAEENDNKLPSWLFFIRSGCTMFCEFWDRIGTGPVGHLTRSWETLVDISKFPHQPTLNYFLAIPSDDWPEEIRVPYNDSALSLAQNFSCLHVLNERVSTLDVVRFWPVKNSVEFVRLLENWHPGALILLAHYCIVLHRAGTKAWYLDGGAASILATILRQLDLRWHRYIEWPLKEVGLPPSTQRITDELPIGSLALLENMNSSVRGAFDF
ncbi:hypothetical protein B7463_g4211, partial [Scytalidium lignicola]